MSIWRLEGTLEGYLAGSAPGPGGVRALCEPHRQRSSSLRSSGDRLAQRQQLAQECGRAPTALRDGCWIFGQPMAGSGGTRRVGQWGWCLGERATPCFARTRSQQGTSYLATGAPRGSRDQSAARQPAVIMAGARGTTYGQRSVGRRGARWSELPRRGRPISGRYLHQLPSPPVDRSHDLFRVAADPWADDLLIHDDDIVELDDGTRFSRIDAPKGG